MNTEASKENIGLALGRLPSGMFIVTFHNEEINEADGLLMSWVQQVSFEPPMIAVAIKKDRKAFNSIKQSGYFNVNIMGKQNNALIGKFFKGGQGAAKFEGMEITEGEFSKAIILKEAVSYLECKVSSIAESAADHVLIFGEIINGELLNTNQNEPSIHLRKSGFDY